jgi:hypothetical protein
MKFYILNIFFIVLIFTANKVTSATLTPLQQDSLVLIDIFDSLAQERTVTFQDWLSDQPLGTWDGITVENNRVTEINLSSKTLKGDMPNSIQNLTALTSLNLSTNKIFSLPASIKKMENLKELFIDHNRLHFSSIEHVYSMTLDSLSYAPQDFLRDWNAPFIHIRNFDKLGAEIGGTQNHYDWRNGWPAKFVNIDSDSIIPPWEGTYSLYITSDSIPNLELKYSTFFVYENTVLINSNTILDKKPLIMDRTIKLNLNGTGTVELLSISGQLITSLKFASKGVLLFNLDPNLSNGKYFIQLRVGGKKEAFSIVLD